MKLHFLNRASTQYQSFSVTRNTHKHFLKVWHYHPELELVLILKSTGTRFIGDSIDKFQEGEVVLIGKNLPHMWLNDEEYYNEDSEMFADAISIHFKKDFLGDAFLEASEIKQIHDLIERAESGVVFSKIDPNTISLIKELDENKKLSSLSRLLKLLEVLDNLSNEDDAKSLSSRGFLSSFNERENQNLKKIYEYIFNNFNKPISSKDVAEVAYMNSSAFSRYFKRIHRKTFTTYLNEIRIGYACKLLIEEKHKVISVCYESGFSNISNFNRQFKKIKKMSPSEFVKRHR